MSRATLPDPGRGWRVRSSLLAVVVFLAGAVVVSHRGNAPATVHRPLHNMVEGYANGKVVAIEYLQTYYCPTTPASDIDPPFGRGNGRTEAQDPKEYAVPPCFFGDTGTNSLLPAQLKAGAFPGVQTFYGLAPWFGATPAMGSLPTALAAANGPFSDVQTQCSEPGPPHTEHVGQPGSCLMHPATLRFAKVFDDPGKQPPDPVPMPHHSHLLPVTSAAPGWWNIVGVEIWDRSIWPDLNGNCPAGPPRCVTSIAALRAAQKAGKASIDLPSNLYWYLAVHPIAD